MFAWNGWALAPAVATAMGISVEHCRDAVGDDRDDGSSSDDEEVEEDAEVVVGAVALSVARWTNLRKGAT